MKSEMESRPEEFQTTIGELIEAITDIALEAGKSEQEGYALASLTIENILRRSQKLETPVIN